ncbi:sigma-70 family RNA polymerase sigma factor [Pedobacter aquatilis]|uniref:RNA polymerase sigma factor n=1 Tax=Pedobacter aquatilis TaxID=351343 RepID=UPI0025B5A905|nr:sigma-70 family RNA polymerase sigma factor [Pedobacter aquatilis]MDN3586256.1 sigma-70 family RNA polymerase sigma factor [Pedobacter aquatilis]
MLARQNIDSDAVRALYLENFATLKAYIIQNQGSGQDAEDIFQEVIVNFIEIVRAGKFRGESSIKTFLYALNRFTWLNELRKRNKTMLREDKYSMEIDNIEPEVSRYITNREDRALIGNTISSLGEVCKKILVAYYYENQSMKSILHLVNFESEQVLRNKKYKCMKSLQQLLSKDPLLAKKFKAALTYE